MRTHRKKWPRKNLGEVLNFLEERHPEGLSLKALANDFKIDEAAISHMFRKDDMKLQKAEEIAGIYGFELKLYFPVRQYKDGYIPRPPDRHYDNAGNLMGLVKYIQDSEYSIPFVAEHCCISPWVLYRAFNSGNIKISTMNLILDKLRLTVIWKFTEREDLAS